MKSDKAASGDRLSVGELLGRPRNATGDPSDLGVGSDSLPQGIAPVRLDDVRRAFDALLRAIMATTAARQSVPLTANVDRWAASQITADELRAFEHPTPYEGPGVPRRPRAADDHGVAGARRAGRRRRRGVRAVDDRATVGLRRVEPAHRVRPRRADIQYHPATRERVYAACHAEGPHRAQGERIWQGVAFTLGA